MSCRTVDQFIDYCEATAIAGRFSRKGCTAAEIDALECKYGVTLPTSYRTFLSVMGHRVGRLFQHDHMDVSYKHVLEITARLPEYIAAEEPRAAPLSLPSSALIIASRHDDWHWFIRCTSVDDSAVWRFSIYHPDQISLADDSLVEWLYSWACEAGEVIDSGYYDP